MPRINMSEQEFTSKFNEVFGASPTISEDGGHLIIRTNLRYDNQHKNIVSGDDTGQSGQSPGRKS